MALSSYGSEPVNDLRRAYLRRKGIIESRIREFERFLGRDEEDIFAELCFCICTPQSKARVCDRAVSRMKEMGVLLGGSVEDISSGLRGVRFRQKKARYIITAREQFSREGHIKIKKKLSGHLDIEGLREWMVANVKGLGYKEASHFLRNVGLGFDMAILDRHILKNLKLAGVIQTIPASLSRKRYLEIESRMRAFSEEIDIPLKHLDLLLWSQETGEVFK
ncbi:MAG: N-glycosylase/DNA lyase [Thermoplasmata archaeon]